MQWSTLLNGKLTYLGATGLLLYGLFQLGSGNYDEAMRAIGEAAGLAGLRRKLELVDQRALGVGSTAALERATGVRQ